MQARDGRERACSERGAVAELRAEATAASRARGEAATLAPSECGRGVRTVMGGALAWARRELRP